MTDLNLAAHVFCPFFGKLNPRSISCEYLGQGYGVITRFKSQTHKNQTLTAWCFSPGGHRACPLAYANYRFYEG